DPVLLDELAGVGHGVLGTIAVVVVDRAHLAAVDAARVVDDAEVEGDPEPGQLGAREGQGPGERVRRADQDLRVRHPLLGGAGRRPQPGESRAQHPPSLSHAFLLVIAARPPGMNSMQMIMIAPKISGRNAWTPARESLSTVTIAAPATEPRTEPS